MNKITCIFLMTLISFGALAELNCRSALLPLEQFESPALRDDNDYLEHFSGLKNKWRILAAKFHFSRQVAVEDSEFIRSIPEREIISPEDAIALRQVNAEAQGLDLNLVNERMLAQGHSPEILKELIRIISGKKYYTEDQLLSYYVEAFDLVNPQPRFWQIFKGPSVKKIEERLITIQLGHYDLYSIVKELGFIRNTSTLKEINIATRPLRKMGIFTALSLWLNPLAAGSSALAEILYPNPKSLTKLTREEVKKLGPWRQLSINGYVLTLKGGRILFSGLVLYSLILTSLHDGNLFAVVEDIVEDSQVIEDYAAAMFNPLPPLSDNLKLEMQSQTFIYFSTVVFPQRHGWRSIDLENRGDDRKAWQDYKNYLRSL